MLLAAAGFINLPVDRAAAATAAADDDDSSLRVRLIDFKTAAFSSSEHIMLQSQSGPKIVCFPTENVR